MGTSYVPRDYFLIYQPIEILRIYALKALIMRHVHARHRVRIGSRSNVRTSIAKLDHNVRIAEVELVQWCSRMELSYPLMREDHILSDCYDDYCNASMRSTDVVACELTRVVNCLSFGSKVLEPQVLDTLMAQQLRSLVVAHHRTDVPDASPFAITLPTRWTRKSIDWYFDLFPLEEVRLPLVSAIESARTHGGIRWTDRERRLFGPALAKPNQDVGSSLGWREHETWRQALEPDQDDEDKNEPWNT